MMCFNLFTVLIVIAEWITIDTRYIPTTHIRQTGWPLPRNTGRLNTQTSWQPGQPISRSMSRSHGPVWQQQRSWGSGLQLDSRMAHRRTTLRPDSLLPRGKVPHNSLALDKKDNLLDSRVSYKRTTLRPDAIMPQRTVPHNSLAFNDKDITITKTSRIEPFHRRLQTSELSRYRSQPYHGKHVISVSSKDDDPSITFTNRHLPDKTSFQHIRDQSITRSRGFEPRKDRANSGLHLRMGFRSSRLSKGPMHNIVIRTKSGKRIDISHSMDRTNIVLNRKSKNRRRLVDVHTRAQPGPPTVNLASSEALNKGQQAVVRDTPLENQIDLNNTTVTSKTNALTSLPMANQSSTQSSHLPPVIAVNSSLFTVISKATPTAITTSPMVSHALTTSTHLPPAIGIPSKKPLISMVTKITPEKQFVANSTPTPNTITNQRTNTSGNLIPLVPTDYNSTIQGLKAISSDAVAKITPILETSNHAPENTASQSSKGDSTISTGNVLPTLSLASTNSLTSEERLPSKDRHLTTDGSDKHVLNGIENSLSSNRLSNSRTWDKISSDHSEKGTSNGQSDVGISNDQSDGAKSDDVSRDSIHSESKGDDIDDNSDYQEEWDK